jgi:four helix bundle protein
MPAISRFEDIRAWQSARALTRDVYAATRSGEFARDPVLRSQMRRAALSIGSNIAEGFEHDRDGEFRHFLSIAKGSAGELRSQLHTAADLGYLNTETFEALAGHCLTAGRSAPS